MKNTYVSPQRRRVLSFKRAAGFIAFLIILAGLVLVVAFFGQNQDVRRRASGESQVQVSVSSNTVDNDHLKVNVLVNTGGSSLAALELRGTLTGANASDISIQNDNTLALTSVADTLTQGTNSVTFRLVRFASTDPNATTTTHGQSTTIISFVITKPSNNQATISFDSGNSSFSLLGQGIASVSYPSSTIFTLTQTQQSTSSPTGGFLIRTYNDTSGDGHQQTNEKGLSWKYQWESNNDNTWHEYETFASSNGEGGVVTLPTGTLVTIKQSSVNGWNATTPTQPSTTIVTRENKLMVFGIRQPPSATARPTARPTTIPTPLPTATPMITIVTPYPTIRPTPTISVVENLIPTPVSTPLPTIAPQVVARTNPLANPVVLIVIGILGLGAAYFLYRGLR